MEFRRCPLVGIKQTSSRERHAIEHVVKRIADCDPIKAGRVAVSNGGELLTLPVPRPVATS
jgi:hypothetical protein